MNAIDSETHFMIQLEKGTIIMECPWRIRSTGEKGFYTFSVHGGYVV